MAKLVVFEFLDGNFEQGFRVNVLIGKDGANPFIKLRGKFPPELTMRLVLYFNNNTPWNCAKFLDYATKLILFAKSCGGYIFIHRLLQDYFANQKLS